MALATSFTKTTTAGPTLVFVMVCFSLMSYVDRTVLSIAGPSIIKEMGITETGMGTVYSAFLLSYTLLMIPGGLLADRLGPRVTLGVLGLAAALLTALTPLSTATLIAATVGGLPVLMTVRLLLGGFSAPLYPTLGRLTANWIPAVHRARVQGLVLSGAPLGSAIAPLVFAPLIAQFGWPVALYVAAAVTGATTLFGIWFIRDHPPLKARAAAVATREETGALRDLLKNRNLLFLAAAYFTLNYFEYIFFYWIYYYFGQVRGLGVQASAVYTTTLLLSMMAGMPVGGWLCDRLTPSIGVWRSRRIVAGGGMVLSAVCLFAGTGCTETAPMVALLSLAIGMAAASEGPFWSAAIESGAGAVGASCGILNGIGNVGGLLAPVMTPWIATMAGWPVSLSFASLLIFLGAMSWLFVRPKASDL
jgi:ACS family glucarate transporter-like MFS transporter